jgi:predicted Ser/Thr protein kinase
MSDTIPMGNPDPARKAPAGVSDSARPCPACGDAFSGPVHSGCRGSDKTVRESRLAPAPDPQPMRPGPAKRKMDSLPEEAVAYDLDPARQVRQYILVQQIGKGGMGTVWRAWDRRLSRWVAIKFLRAEEDRGIDRFEREAKIAARLRHPHIAAIYEVGEAPSATPGGGMLHFLVMEFIDGQTLATVKLPQRNILEIFRNVARALDTAHKGGIIHRDLKPLNIMITRDEWPYVMDFGLAKSTDADSSLSQSGDVMGTPSYMSPEQAEGRLSDLDGRSDIYSLGATMYSVLLGRPPHVGQSTYDIIHRVVRDPVTPPRSIQPDFPPEVQAILMKAMAKDPRLRFATAGEMAEELAAYLDGSKAPAAVAPEPPIVFEAPPRPAGRKGLVVGVALGLLAAAAGAALLGRRPAAPEKPSVPAAAAAPPIVHVDPTPPPPLPAAATPKGVFTLSVAVHPFAELVRITCDGAPVATNGRFTPFQESGLRLGSYELVLRHPQLGEKTVTLAEANLKAGKTYVVWGRMDSPSLEVKESP